MAYRHVDFKSLIVYSVLMLAAYTVSLLIDPGPFTYLLVMPAYMLVTLIAIARANNITEHTARMNARRFGFAIVIGVMALYIVEPVFGSWPRWPRVFFSWGVALVWSTTEKQPPLWELVAGQLQGLTLWQKVVSILRQVHGSEKP